MLAAITALKDAGELEKWGAALEALPPRRSVQLGELRLVGVKDPQAIATPSLRNDAAFLFSVVASTSVLAVVLGQLPGDWGEHCGGGGGPAWRTLRGQASATAQRQCRRSSLPAPLLRPCSLCPGFFSSYLSGGISLAVLAVGSVNPGILQAAIDSFSQARRLHEAGCPKPSAEAAAPRRAPSNPPLYHPPLPGLPGLP